MRFFLDANALIYSATASDYRDPCVEILDAIAEGEAEGVTSTAALEEVWHIELSGRAGDLGGLTGRTYELLSPLLTITDEIFRRALALDAASIGANDRLHVACCQANGIDTIVSADPEFDDVRGIRRVDPIDGEARAGLLSEPTGS